MVCRIPSVHTGVGLITDFLWSGVKLAIWFSTFLLTITCAEDVQKAHARPFSTFTLQGLSNGIKNTSSEVFWPLKLSSELAGVSEDSKFPLLGVWVSSSHLPQSGVATFDLYNCPLKIQESIRTPIPKVGTHLKVWGFIPSHFPTLLGAWNVTLGLHLWLAPF